MNITGYYEINTMDPNLVVCDHIRQFMPLLRDTQIGAGLTKPWLRPTHGPHYGPILYCWDHHHMGMRFAAEGQVEYLRYLPDNLLHHQKADGRTPCFVHRDTGVCGDDLRIHAQPFLMQSSFLYVFLTGDRAWLGQNWTALTRYLRYYELRKRNGNGLFFWSAPWLSGLDNDAATSFLPGDTVSPADINAWMYLEYLAAARLARMAGEDSAATEFARSAQTLHNLVNKLLWDDETGTYAALNLATGRQFLHFEDPYIGNFGRFAYQSASNLIPLYARMAPPDRADRMIDRFLLSPDHFLSPHGIRSLSRSSAYYNNAIWGNPPRFEDPDRLTNSNWQGPVWFPICYFAFHALLHYGRREQAEDVRLRILTTLAHSVTRHGSFYENYDAETGTPLYASEFASWNILADQMAMEMHPDQWLMEPVFHHGRQ